MKKSIEFPFLSKTRLLPKELENVIKELSKNFRLSEERNEHPHEEKYITVRNKLKQDEALSKDELCTLCYFFEKLREEMLFDVFWEKLTKAIGQFQSVSCFLKPLAFSMYDNYKSLNQFTEVFKLIKIIIKKIPERRKRFQYMKALLSFDGSSNPNEVVAFDKDEKIRSFFIDKIKFEFSLVTSLEEVIELSRKIFISNQCQLFLESIIPFITKKHKEKSFFDTFKSYAEIMEIPLKKRLFSSIISQYINNSDIKSYSDDWFHMAYKELGDPFDDRNHKWDGIDNKVKDVFRIWRNENYIREFFLNKVRGSDRRRLKFWKDYVYQIYRIDFFEDADCALVMEFKNHTLVEFNDKGALYIYYKEDKNINQTRDFWNRNDYGKRVAQKLKFLKNRKLAYNFLAHIFNDWESKFFVELKKLGYNIV